MTTEEQKNNNNNLESNDFLIKITLISRKAIKNNILKKIYKYI